VHNRTKHCARQHGQDQCEPGWYAVVVVQLKVHIGAGHDEGGLREVQQAGASIDQNHALGHHRVKRPGGEPDESEPDDIHSLFEPFVAAMCRL
jgi:hypothetical protein